MMGCALSLMSSQERLSRLQPSCLPYLELPAASAALPVLDALPSSHVYLPERTCSCSECSSQARPCFETLGVGLYRGSRNVDVMQAKSHLIPQVGPVSIGKVAAPSWETRTALLHSHGKSEVWVTSPSQVTLLMSTCIDLSRNLSKMLYQSLTGLLFTQFCCVAGSPSLTAEERCECCVTAASALAKVNS